MKKYNFTVELVEHDIYVYVGRPLLEVNKEFKDVEDDVECEGFHSWRELKEGGMAHIIYLSKKDTGLLFHEIVHCSSSIMTETGISSEEFMAYTCEYLYNKIKKHW